MQKLVDNMPVCLDFQLGQMSAEVCLSSLKDVYKVPYNKMHFTITHKSTVG